MVVEVGNCLKTLEAFHPGFWTPFVIEPVEVDNLHWVKGLTEHVAQWPAQNLKGKMLMDKEGQSLMEELCNSWAKRFNAPDGLVANVQAHSNHWFVRDQQNAAYKEQRQNPPPKTLCVQWDAEEPSF